MTRPAARLLEGQLRRYRHTWRSSAASTVVLPLLLLLVPGLGIGPLVDGTGAFGQLSYLQFIAPAILAAIGLQIALAEAVMPVFAGVRITRIVPAALATPLRPEDFVDGYLAWIVLRTLIAAAVVLVPAIALNAVPASSVGLLLGIAVMVALAHAPLFLAFTIRQQDPYTPAALGRLFVLPVMFGAATFVPVRLLPGLVARLATLTPLWHGVQLSRASAGISTISPAVVLTHLSVLALYAAGGYVLARHQFHRRLVP